MEIKIGTQMSPRFCKMTALFSAAILSHPLQTLFYYMFLMESSCLGRHCLQWISVIALHCGYK